MPRDNSLAWEAEAKRFLRDRLDARDEGRLSTLLTGKTLTFNEWANYARSRLIGPRRRTATTSRCSRICDRPSGRCHGRRSSQKRSRSTSRREPAAIKKEDTDKIRS